MLRSLFLPIQLPICPFLLLWNTIMEKEKSMTLSLNNRFLNGNVISVFAWFQVSTSIFIMSASNYRNRPRMHLSRQEINAPPLLYLQRRSMQRPTQHDRSSAEYPSVVHFVRVMALFCSLHLTFPVLSCLLTTILLFVFPIWIIRPFILLYILHIRTRIPLCLLWSHKEELLFPQVIP